MKYFKKVNPRQALYTSDGAPIHFEAVDKDTGIYPHEGNGISPELTKQIEAAIAGQRGGVSAITEAEYKELVEKKKNSPPPKRNWRQELSMGNQAPDTVARATGPQPQPPEPLPNPADAVAGGKPVAVAEPPKATKRAAN